MKLEVWKMKKEYQRRVAQLVFALLFVFGISQLAAAEDLGSYTSDEVQSFTADSLSVTELWLNKPTGLVNNVEQQLDVSPFLKDGRTMVPLRFIGESNGADVKWSDPEQKITIALDGNTIILWIGKTEAKINNNTVYLDVPAMKSNGRTVVPLRFVSENLKLKVDYDDNAKKITISSNAGSATQAPNAQTPEPKVTKPTVPTPQVQQPVSTNEQTLRTIVSSNKTYTGLSSQDDYSTKYSITFFDFTQSGEFKGKVKWIGSNVTDDLVGKISGDQLTFTQTARYQNNKSTPMDVDVTMKIEGNNRVSGTWKDNQTGIVGTTWFEFEPIKQTPIETPQKNNSEVQYDGNFDAKGFPIGKWSIDFGDYFSFDGELNVEENNAVAIGVITYPDGTKVIGRFVNGKPDGLNSIIYPNQKAYLVDFVYGQPVDVYRANTIPTFKSDEIDLYKAQDIEMVKADDIEYFQADDIEWFQADDIEQFQADDIEPYKAEMIDLFQAEQVKKLESVVDIEKYQAEVVKVNPPGAHSNIPVGGFTSPDYMNPMVQAWTSHMLKLPYLINNNMYYSY